jgi:hypothetical protein
MEQLNPADGLKLKNIIASANWLAAVAKQFQMCNEKTGITAAASRGASCAHALGFFVAYLQRFLNDEQKGVVEVAHKFWSGISSDKASGMEKCSDARFRSA